MSLNWDDILAEQAKEAPGLAPEAKYIMQVESAEGVIASTGSLMIKLKARIAEGPYVSADPIWTNIVFTTSNAKAMKMTLRKLAALGITRDFLASRNPDHIAIAAAIDAAKPHFEGEVSVKEWNDEKRNEINMIRPVPGSTPAAISAPADAATPPVPDVPTGAPGPTPSGTEHLPNPF